MKKTAQHNAGSGTGTARVFRLGSFAVIGFLCGCNATRSGVLAENKTAVPVVEATTAAAQSDFAIDPIDTALKTDAPAKSADAVRPWLALQSIGFFSDRADLSAWESTKVAEIVEYLSRHSEAEVGINRPAVAPDGDPDVDDLNHRRVRTIINGLLTAGVAEDRILVGNFVDLPPSLDQRVEVLTRRAL